MSLTGPRLKLNLEPMAHCVHHALLHMAPKWSSHRTIRAGQDFVRAKFYFPHAFANGY